MLLNCGAREDSWVLWLVRRSNQSFLKEINSECSLERLMLKLKLQYFGYLMLRASSLEEILMLGKIEGRRRKRWQRIRCLNGITYSMDISLSKLQETVKDRKAWCPAMCTNRHDLATEQQHMFSGCIWIGSLFEEEFSNIYPYFNYY